MIRRQRLDVEDVEPGVPDVARLQRVDHGGFVGQCGARGVDEDDARLHRRDPLCREEAACVVVQQEMQRDDIALRQQWFDVDEIDAGISLGRPVPGQHAQAAAERDARHLRGDAAKADQAQGLAGQLHSVFAQPVAGAHLAVHLGDAARRRPHQCDGGFGHRRVAIASNQMNLDAEFGELLRVHIAARAGAEKHHMLQANALARDFGRQRGVIDDRDPGAIEHFWQLLRRHIRVAMNANHGIARLGQPLEDDRQRFVGIDKNPAHRNLRCLTGCIDVQDATPASASTVCIRTLAPAVQSACVASSSSLWLTPSLQGTTNLVSRIAVLWLQPRWPAPDVMRRWEKPSFLAASSTASTSFGSKWVGGLCQIRSRATSTLRRAEISLTAARKSEFSASMIAASALRQSIVKAISPGMTLREGLAMTASPMVPTALGPCFLAIASIASTISDKVASASRRSCIGVEPAWLSKPVILPSYHNTPWPESTTPMVLPSASRIGPCSMCNSTKPENFWNPTGLSPR